MSLVPYVVEQTARRALYDIFSRLLNDRIVMLGEEVNATTASLVVAQLLYLEAQDPDKDIQFYINSPGGSVTDGMAIYDTMQYIKCDVSTICGYGRVHGRAAAGRGHQGQAPCAAQRRDNDPPALRRRQGPGLDIKIQAEWMLRTREKLNRILSECTGKSIEQVAIDTERDNFMPAEEALQYGLIDKVIYKR